MNKIDVTIKLYFKGPNLQIFILEMTVRFLSLIRPSIIECNNSRTVNPYTLTLILIVIFFAAHIILNSSPFFIVFNVILKLNSHCVELKYFSNFSTSFGFMSTFFFFPFGKIVGEKDVCIINRRIFFERKS